mmetsp:Transcript_21510/g.48580  ORF Transcript_21510/g.48580 Transcript_21510/m.48580 type:complete len:518 (-) Transcript_21510:207-1760(-)
MPMSPGARGVCYYFFMFLLGSGVVVATSTTKPPGAGRAQSQVPYRSESAAMAAWERSKVFRAYRNMSLITSPHLLAAAAQEWWVKVAAPAARASPPSIGSAALFFLHVPKTGGTTIEGVFEKLIHERPPLCWRRYMNLWEEGHLLSTSTMGPCSASSGFLVFGHASLDLAAPRQLLSGRRGSKPAPHDETPPTSEAAWEARAWEPLRVAARRSRRLSLGKAANKANKVGGASGNRTSANSSQPVVKKAPPPGSQLKAPPPPSAAAFPRLTGGGGGGAAPPTPPAADIGPLAGPLAGAPVGAPVGVYWVTWVREPLARAVSFANYYTVPKRSFEQGEWRAYATNAATSMINGVPGLGAGVGAWYSFPRDPRSCAYKRPPGDGAAPQLRCLESGAAALARWRLEHALSFVGDTAQFAESAWLLQRTFGWGDRAVLGSLAHPNVAFSRPGPVRAGFKRWAVADLSPKVAALIRNAEVCDGALYSFGAALVKSRLGALSPADKVDLGRFRAKVKAGTRARK